MMRILDGDGTVVCERCEVAGTFAARLRGLMGRAELPAGDGLLLRPGGSVHTCFMRMPIDVVLLDGDMRVVRIVSTLRPWRATGARGARAVLELAAGQAAKRGLQPGAMLALVPAGGPGA